MRFIISENRLEKYCGDDTEVILPPVATIAPLAFALNNTVKHVIIPDTVTAIQENTFKCCYALEAITLPPRLQYLGKGAFNNCHSLREISIPEGIVEIPEFYFFACTALKQVQLPSTLARIGKGAFELCLQLSADSLHISSRTSVEPSAFKNCCPLERERSIPVTRKQRQLK